MANGHGGARANAGAKPGSAHPGTKEKNLLRAKARDLIGPHMAELIAAHAAHAKGLSYLVYRDKKTGQWVRVKSLEDVDQTRDAIEVWEKDPSTQSFTDLMNRLLDKPSEHVEMEITGGDELLARLDRGRDRARKP